MSIPFPEPSKDKIKFTFIDLFAGIGGIRIALQNLGGKCVFSSEIDPASRTTYKNNFGEFPAGDIRDFTNSSISDRELDNLIPDCDVLAAGFPCQPFSIAGVSARQALGQYHGFEDINQGNLFFDIVRIAKVKKPKVLFLENVKNFINHDKGKTFAIVKKTITEELNYTLNYKVIDSSSLVPQRRVRCYMVCFRENISYEFPELGEKNLPLRLILENNVPDDFTISNKLWEGHIKRSARNKARGTGFTVQLVDINKPSNTIVSRYYKDGKECLIPQVGKNPRMLTPRECARLQGFPENFVIHASKIKAYQQFGNSVVVPLIYKLANNFLPQITKMSYSHNLIKEGYKTSEDLLFWEKCYWYLRYLIASKNKLGKDTKRCIALHESLITTYKLISLREESEEDQLEILHSVFKQNLFKDLKKDSKKKFNYQDLYLDLQKLLISPKDYYILAITIKELVLPTNEALDKVPTNEVNEFVTIFAKAILDVKKEQGLINLVRDWDDFTGMLAMNKERDLIIELYRNVREKLNDKSNFIEGTITDSDLDIILTALCQEYERRVGQKRKYRAGSDLENSIEYILKYFKIPTGGRPKHFTTSLEVDNWILTKKGLYIGICLKRTLRERWKQSYTTDPKVYEENKIALLVHVICDDSDLSKAKIIEIGQHKSILFIPDRSRILKELQKDSEVKDYIYPMTQLINYLKTFIDNN